MNYQASSTVVQAASLLLFVSLSSCASVANYVLTGRYEDPNAEEAVAKPNDSPAPPKEIAPASTPEAGAAEVEKKAELAKPEPEPPAPVAEVNKPVPFDGCTNADGTLPVYMGIGIKMAKKTCGIGRSIDGEDASLTIGKLSITFTTLSKPPDIAKDRAGAEKLRKIAAENKAQVEISVVGDQTYTLISSRVKKSDGATLGFVEHNKTIGDEHFRCQARLEGPDTQMLPTAKQICASMRAIK